MILLTQPQVERLVKSAPEGKNTTFLRNAYNLWHRFKNFEKNSPAGLEVDGKIVALIFATHNRDGTVNLYEIVTVQGHEGNGYATRLWNEFMEDAYAHGSRRLKLSCTPSSVTWHLRNGLVFWAVDNSGSLRSEQPLMPTAIAQQKARLAIIKDPRLAELSPKTVQKFLSEQLPPPAHMQGGRLSRKKYEAALEATKKVGDAWLAPRLDSLK